MENKKFGLIEGFEVNLVKIDNQYVEAMAKKIEEEVPKVKAMLRYNVFTVNQFVQLSGLHISTVNNKCRPAFVDGEINTELDWCFPHPDKIGEGPKFIIRNEKSEKYLRV